MYGSRFLAILGFIIIGVTSRLIPHPPNFTAINAIALFSAFYQGNLWFSLATVTSTLFFSDAILGFHSTMPFVYLGFALTILLGYQFRSNLSTGRIVPVSLASSLLFFLVSNFGVWMSGFLYPKTFHGLGLCYLAAIPFLGNQILSDLVYCGLLSACFIFGKSVFQRKIMIHDA
jgi:hypothetical protein